MSAPTKTPPYLRGARFRAYDPETDVVGDSSAWTRRRTYVSLAVLGIIAAFLLLVEFGGWDR